jgi:hypothetical protein
MCEILGHSKKNVFVGFSWVWFVRWVRELMVMWQVVTNQAQTWRQTLIILHA